MLGKSHACLNLLACVLLHQRYYLCHHLLFILRDRTVVRGLVRELTVRVVAFRKVGVQPHFDLPVTVDADHVFGWLEVPYPKENFFEAIEGAEEYV